MIHPQQLTGIIKKNVLIQINPKELLFKTKIKIPIALWIVTQLDYLLLY